MARTKDRVHSEWDGVPFYMIIAARQRSAAAPRMRKDPLLMSFDARLKSRAEFMEKLHTSGYYTQ